jgi:hypothetical protein
MVVRKVGGRIEKSYGNNRSTCILCQKRIKKEDIMLKIILPAWRVPAKKSVHGRCMLDLLMWK